MPAEVLPTLSMQYTLQLCRFPLVSQLTQLQDMQKVFLHLALHFSKSLPNAACRTLSEADSSFLQFRLIIFFASPTHIT